MATTKTEELLKIREAVYGPIIRDEARAIIDRWMPDADKLARLVVALVDGLPADTRRDVLDVLNDKYPADGEEQAQG